MKRNLIYSVFAAILLASCSSDDIAPVPVPAPETLDAYISLGITNGTVKTKADNEASDTSYGDGGVNQDPAGTTAINSFTVAIFRGALSATASSEGIVAPATEPEGSLIYLNTFKTDNLIDQDADAAKKLCVAGVVGTENGKNYQINGIKIKGGNIHVLIMANMPDDLLKDKTSITMATMRELVYGNLAGEGFNNDGDSYPCSMTSKWLKYDVTPKDNGDVFYLFNDNSAIKANETTQVSKADSDRTFEEANGDAIPLYRNVSAVGLQRIILKPSPAWGGDAGAKLVIKKIFVANAIDSTSMTAGTTLGKYEFHSGYNIDSQSESAIGALVAQANDYNSSLIFPKQEVNEGETVPTYPLGDFTKNNTYNKESGNPCIEKYFMLYENSAKMNLGEGRQTLFILCADYIYKDEDNEPKTLSDRYYAVVVNDASNTGADGSVGYGKYVERNYIYKINLTIVGPGSINPYDPLYTANATAFVEAAPWEGAIDINQDAE